MTTKSAPALVAGAGDQRRRKGNNDMPINFEDMVGIKVRRKCRGGKGIHLEPGVYEIGGREGQIEPDVAKQLVQAYVADALMEDDVAAAIESDKKRKAAQAKAAKSASDKSASAQGAPDKSASAQGALA